VIIASDRVRKRLANLAPTARVGGAWQSGAYTAAETDRTYTGLLARGAPRRVVQAHLGKREMRGRWEALERTFETLEDVMQALRRAGAGERPVGAERE
jgi:predicted kinase